MLWAPEMLPPLGTLEGWGAGVALPAELLVVVVLPAEGLEVSEGLEGSGGSDAAQPGINLRTHL